MVQAWVQGFKLELLQFWNSNSLPSHTTLRSRLFGLGRAGPPAATRTVTARLVTSGDPWPWQWWCLTRNPSRCPRGSRNLNAGRLGNINLKSRKWLQLLQRAFLIKPRPSPWRPAPLAPCHSRGIHSSDGHHRLTPGRRALATWRMHARDLERCRRSHFVDALMTRVPGPPPGTCNMNLLSESVSVVHNRVLKRRRFEQAV
jgi:hypothetical protein